MEGSSTTKMTTQVGKTMITIRILENKILKSIVLDDITLKQISSDRLDQENLLTDQSKVLGSSWGELKKQAMEPEYLDNNLKVS